MRGSQRQAREPSSLDLEIGVVRGRGLMQSCEASLMRERVQALTEAATMAPMVMPRFWAIDSLLASFSENP